MHESALEEERPLQRALVEVERALDWEVEDLKVVRSG
jgi:hypothetical protein